jgi:hypothetical protein
MMIRRHLDVCIRFSCRVTCNFGGLACGVVDSILTLKDKLGSSCAEAFIGRHSPVAVSESQQPVLVLPGAWSCRWRTGEIRCPKTCVCVCVCDVCAGP